MNPKTLILDIETSPILAYVWGLWENNVSLNQIKSDWHVLAWAAKWLGDPPSKILYMDQRNAKDIADDSKILRGIWDLLNEADIIITQNGKQFDEKKLNARFVLQGFKPPKSYKHIDVKQIAKSRFGFTSNKLEYMSSRLCKKYKKYKTKKFQGFDLWSECLRGNKAAWSEMEKYNKLDVLSLEEVYIKLRPWDKQLNLNLYSDSRDSVCTCGGKNFMRFGYRYTSVGKYQRFICKDCGSEFRGRTNMLKKPKMLVR